MTKQYKMKGKTYTFLKWAGLIACPAIATFIGGVGPVWGMSDCDAIVTTVNAVGILIGALIGYSAATAKEVEA